jgi:hypothetical protein
MKKWNDWLADVVEFLQRTGIAYTDLVELLMTRFINPQQRILLYAPDSKCDLSVTRLQHLDGTLLGDAELGNMHRFIRLWRKLGWSIADLDRALTALTATDINDVVLHQLAHIKQLQDDLKISSLQVLLSLWAPIDTYGNDSLYKKLFLSKAALHIDAVFQVQADGAVLSDTRQTIAGHIPALLAALRVSETDLAAIRSDAGLDADTAVLSLAHVSTLYRYAVLAKALKLRIPDLLALKTLSGLNPFATPEQTIAFAIEQTIAFVMVVDKVKQSGFTVAQLNYLYRHLTAPPANFAPQPTTLLLLAKTLRDSLTQIAQDNTLAPDPTGDLMRVKLALLFDSATVDQTIRLINGSAVYVAPLATLPSGIVFPDLVKNKVTYDQSVKVLRFQGAMTTAEQSALLGASADQAYQTAVNNLFQQPLTFIQNTLSGFLDVMEGQNALVQNTSSLDQALKQDATAIASKFTYLLGKLLPYLITRLSHALAKQTIADALKLDGGMAQLLLESQMGQNQAPIAALLALATPGLTCHSRADGELLHL